MKVAFIIVCIIALLFIGASYYFYNAYKNTKIELEAKVVDMSQEKEVEISRLTDTYDRLVADMKQEIEMGQIKITQLYDRLSVSMVDKILFPSGEAVF
jgi:hypothetical protein